MNRNKKTYQRYEQNFKKALYRLSFILCVFICTIYFYINVQRGDILDASANIMVVILSLLGLLFMHLKIGVDKLFWLPAMNYIALYLTSFIGSPSSPDTASLFWCLTFYPVLIITLGHKKSLPFILIMSTITFFGFYGGSVDSSGVHPWLNVIYTQDEKQTFIVTSLILSIIVLYSEYIRFKLSKGLVLGRIEKKHIQYLSTHDELTGLYNRRGFKAELESPLQFDKRKSDQHAVILIDIDNFKELNDNYGHAFGDIVLRNIAKLQQASVRSSDKVIRWGGEEFLIYLKNITQKEVHRIAENIRLNVAKTPVANTKDKVNVTVSIGIANSSERDTLQALIELADERLYKAKSNNKNCIIFDDSILSNTTS